MVRAAVHLVWCFISIFTYLVARNKTANGPFDGIFTMSKPAAEFHLSDSDRTELQAWLHKATLDPRLARRARIPLDLDAAVPPAQISARLGLSAPVVFKRRNRYQACGLEGLSDRPRPGQPRKLTQQKVREILTLTAQRIPAEAILAKSARARTATV
jgi:hypothetical protein